MNVAAAPGAAEALSAYVSVRDRLPGARVAGRAERACFADVASGFDTILFDAYGVLNQGDRAIPGAARRIAALRAAGKRVMVVSNSAGYPKARMMERYARLGFDFGPEEVTTSREALIHYLQAAPPTRWGAMMNEASGVSDLEGLDIHCLGDAATAYDEAQGFLLVGIEGWSPERHTLLSGSLRDDPRPVIVGNPDLVSPRETGLASEPGWVAHRLADETGVAPVFLGKPFPEIFDLALSRLSPPSDPSRILMVGDTLHTDILGGHMSGMATALVTGFGSLTGLDIDEAIATSGIAPDFVVERI